MNNLKITFLFGFFLFTVLLSFLFSDWAGICLIYVSFIIIWLDKDIINDWRLLLLVVLILGAHHAASILNAYYITFMGADLDAVSFHEMAVNRSNSIQPLWFSEFGSLETATYTYTGFLAFFYRIFGDSKLLGQQLSVLAFAISIVLLSRFTHQLKLKQWRIAILAMYGLLPSMMVYTSITMREVYQILFYFMIIYWTFSMRHRITVGKMFMIAVSGILLGVLHNGLFIYSIFLVGLSFFWGLRLNIYRWKSQNLGKRLVGVLLLVVILGGWLIIATDMSGASRALMSGESADYIGGYRDKTTGTFDRATYGEKLDTSSIGSFIPSAIMVFIYYMFAPFPWQISRPVDIYAALEGLLRLSLMYHAVLTWRQSRGERRSQWGYLLICFFSLELLWAVGTANWGTAIRHHIVAYSLLVVLGGPRLINSTMRIIFRRGLTFKQRSARKRISRPRLLLPGSQPFNR